MGPLLALCVPAWVVLCVAGEVWSRSHPPTHTPLTTRPDGPVVQLRCATLPSVLRAVAVHYWFTVYDPRAGRWRRWEVWQEADAGGTSWGHLHRDLMPCDAGVGGGPAMLVREWHGDAARALCDVLADPEAYPDRHRYLAWPGPNSNGYAAWVLRRAGVAMDLDPRGIGKDYHGLLGAGPSLTGTGYQVESPLFGLKLGLTDGVEVHVLCLTAGHDFWPPALKTPSGRIGFAE
jgi:hypothetical protein